MSFQPPRRKPNWDRKKEDSYYQANWRFQRRLVHFFLIPAPCCLFYWLYWKVSGQPGWPPLVVWAILIGSVAFTLMASFVFWRCPACNQILYKTSASTSPYLFWLSDPADCPQCGIALIERARKIPRSSGRL